MDEKEFFQEMVDWLQGDDPRERASSLMFFMDYPTADPKILALIEPLLEDRTIAIVSIPITFQEVRRFAAFALAACRAKAGIDEVVHLKQTFRSYSYDSLYELREKFSVSEECRDGDEGARIRCLIDLGVIPVYNLTLDPKEGEEAFRDTRINRSRSW